MLTTINYQPPSSNNTRVQSGELSRVFVIRCLYAKIRGRGNEPSQGRGRRGIWQIIFDISRLTAVVLWGKYKYCECNAASQSRAQSKDIFTIVPDVMLDDWHLKCIILQDRNLHDDTLAQSRSAKLMQVQRRDCILCNFSAQRILYPG